MYDDRNEEPLPDVRSLSRESWAGTSQGLRRYGSCSRVSERTGPHLSLPVRRSVPSLFSSWMMAFLGFTTNRYRRQTFMYSRLSSLNSPCRISRLILDTVSFRNSFLTFPFPGIFLQALILGPAVREVAIQPVEPGGAPGGPLGTVKADHHIPAVENLPVSPALGQRGKGHGSGICPCGRR